MCEISIIVPTCNRAPYLEEAITSLVNQAYGPAEYEIIVVDNGSTDGTREKVERAKREHPRHRIRYLYEPEPGLLAGRHLGAREAQGQTLVFVDDDIEAYHGWLSGIQESFQDSSVEMVGGRNLPRYEIAPPSWLDCFWSKGEYGRWCASLSLLDFGDRVKDIDPVFVWGLNFAIRRHTLVRLGGFHPDLVPSQLQRFQGDGETGLALKAGASGVRAVYQPRAIVWHQIGASRLTVEYFEKRWYYQGVCDSFTRIRREGGVAPERLPLRRRLVATARVAVEGIRELISGQGAGKAEQAQQMDPCEPVNVRVRRAYSAGYRFHRREVASDPELLRWVLRGDYWDYRLPQLSRTGL